MSDSTLKQLVGALAIAVAVWFVVSLFSRGAGSIAPGGEVATFFDRPAETRFDAVRIGRPSGSVELERTEGGWTVNGFPTDDAMVAQLLVDFERADVGDLVATNPANHARMGVSADSALTLELEIDGGSRTILVGDRGQRYGTAYVRLPGADEVYLLTVDMRSQVDRDVDAWRNRTMAAVDSASVERIEVERIDDSYALVRGDSAWLFEDGGEVVATAVNRILAELSNLVATGFVAEGDSIGSLDREATTRAYGASGELLIQLSFGEGAGDRWATSSADEYVYRLSSFRAEGAAPPRSSVQPGG